ncbi:MAG: prealbumin-like fold domain-containing protein [Candidatus Limiplasma sp.]|nr:prealbumin-like fold domain-containing protein [Candidatus Limiplasma sp.]
MRKKLLCALLALCFALMCQTAFAVGFSDDEYEEIAFKAIGGARDSEGKLCDNLWLGTVEASGLGTAYLYTFVDVYEGKTQGFLYLYGDTGYLAYAGELPLRPCNACTLPQGNWTIRFLNGEPALMLNGLEKEKIEGVKINSFQFSIPVVDQYGEPVVGAVFDLKTVTWGGNDEMSLGTVTTGADGILHFPGTLKADGAYWFEQISAPSGYEPMQEKLVALEMDLDKGAISAMTNTEHPNEVRLSQVTNRRQGVKPTSTPIPTPTPGTQLASRPPLTGDNTPVWLWGTLALVCVVVAVGLVLWLRKGEKK